MIKKKNKNSILCVLLQVTKPVIKVTSKSVSQNKTIMQIHHSMKFLMSLVSKLNNLFNELNHRWRLHWRLLRSNSKSFSKSNCVRQLGTKIHVRTHLERTKNWLNVSVPHTPLYESKGSKDGKQWFAAERALLVNSCWFHFGGREPSLPVFWTVRKNHSK